MDLLPHIAAVLASWTRMREETQRRWSGRSSSLVTLTSAPYSRCSTSPCASWSCAGAQWRVGFGWSRARGRGLRLDLWTGAAKCCCCGVCAACLGRAAAHWGMYVWLCVPFDVIDVVHGFVLVLVLAVAAAAKRGDDGGASPRLPLALRYRDSGSS